MKTNKQEHEEYEIPETTAPDCNRKACTDDVTSENSTSEACCQHGERTSHTESPTSEKEDTEEDKRYRLRRKIVSVVSFAVLIAFFAVVTITVGKPLIEKLEDPDGFRRWVDGHHLWGRLAFIGMTILQVVVAVIPGEPMEIGAGYAFGAWEGMFLCLVGVALGSAIIYAFTRLLGVRMVEAFISREKLNSLSFIRNHRKLNLIIFIAFLIPGTPKDVLTYFIGLTPMKLHVFLGLSLAARIPSVISSTLGGDALGSQNYTMAIVVFAVTAVLSLIAILIYKRHPGMKAEATVSVPGGKVEKTVKH